MRVAYFTDTEGRWNKLEDFCRENPNVQLRNGRLELEPGVILVFGGDAVDRGPASVRLLRCLVDVYDRYPGRVVLLAGNRDINKLRLPRELNGHPRTGAPEGSRADILRWTLSKTMGASHAFEHRRQECGGVSDEAVVDSFLEDVEEGGPLLSFLERACLGWRWEETLVVHGAVTEESLGTVPGRAHIPGVDAWLSALNDFYHRQLAAYRAAPRSQDHAALVAYQAPLAGTRMNQQSVVYGRPAFPDGNPRLPELSVRTQLLHDGVRRLMVGHTPSGDCPSVLRDRGFEMILADNAYGTLEAGSMVWVDGMRTCLRGTVQIRDEGPQQVTVDSKLNESSFIGHHDREGRLIKGFLDDGRYLLFRFLPHFQAEETAVRHPDC